jgi:DNA-binding transcriptional LysR family regulator
MQIEALKLFCDVARCRSFSQAAQLNDVTQSAASQVVLQLEKRTGVQLIDRSTRPLTLTSFGQTYYEGCKSLLEQYAELEGSIRTAQAQLAGTVQVAAIYSVSLWDMEGYVERFRSERPSARIHLEYLHPDRVYERVRDGAADLGLVSFPRKSPKLTVLPWRDEEMMLACSPMHALARQPAVRLPQILGEKYIHFDKGLIIRREIDRFLREHEISVDVVLEFDNIENIKKAIEIGAGVALLPEPTFRREVDAAALVAVPLARCRLTRPLGIIHRRHQKLNASAQRFMELLRADNSTPSLPRAAAASNGNGSSGPTAGDSARARASKFID